MAYRIACDCESCEQIRADAFEDFSELVEDVLAYHGIESGPPDDDGGDLVSHLAAEMMVAAGLTEDVEPHTEEQVEVYQAKVFGDEIESEFRRLFHSGNVVSFRRKEA